MQLKIDNYYVRNWQKSDIPALFKYADNPKIAVNLRDAFPSPYKPADAEKFLAIVLEMNPCTYFAIANHEEAIGSIGFMAGKDVHRFSAEMGYWLAEPFWGRGIITKAVRAVTDYAFREFGLNRIYAEPFADNIASVRVLEKAGFTLEGRLRANVVKRGKVLDQLLFAKLREGL
ncbi:GNAT family N-acetyltransferase [candidate division KSB1 bacterium]|nr:GNAT family N-acetyltransferase [candidate division KSB1 bacterium]